jgi:hypothetical protein
MELNEAQIRYLNGTALQMLMQLDPEYTEANKRKIYHKTIKALSLDIIDMYWESKIAQRGH